MLIVDRNGKREVKVVASGLYRPNGVAFKDGALYIADFYNRIIGHYEVPLDDPRPAGGPVMRVMPGAAAGVQAVLSTGRR